MIRKQPRIPHLLRHTVLGEEAVYRVVGVAGDCVEVEVISAPGLRAGTRLRFTQAAVARMSVVEEPVWQRGRERSAGKDQDPAKSATPHAARR
jgi:hypothetical protein